MKTSVGLMKEGWGRRRRVSGVTVKDNAEMQQQLLVLRRGEAGQARSCRGRGRCGEGEGYVW